MPCGIYRITVRPTGESYVGKSIDIDGRWREHRRDMIRERHTPIFQFKFSTYGMAAFQFKTLEECDPGELDEREDYWVGLLRPTLNGKSTFPVLRAGLPPVLDTVEHRLCQRCGLARRYWGDRFCKFCIPAVVKEMSEANYLCC